MEGRRHFIFFNGGETLSSLEGGRGKRGTPPREKVGLFLQLNGERKGGKGFFLYDDQREEILRRGTGESL